MILDPSEARVAADLASADFQSGVVAGHWRVISFAYPILDFVVLATEPDGSASEYGFQAELTNYPAVAPKVQIWNHERNCILAAESRPKGGPKVQGAFKHWGDDTVYRPWDRQTGPHCSNTGELPHLAWYPTRTLTFIFEDLYGLLNSNARALRISEAA